MNLFKKLRSKAAHSLNNKKGQGAVEYVLIIGVAAMVILALKKPITDKLTSLFDKSGSKADEVFQ